MQRKLEVAFSSVIAGIFTLDSPIGGSDVIADVVAFEGEFDDITSDVQGVITVTGGTDELGGTLQAGSMTVTVSRPDDPGYWNPNNPSSPLVSEGDPGFVPIRPGRLTETDDDGTVYGVFYGFLRRAPWTASTRSCQLYFEDLLFRAERVFPVIGPTGPTTTGAAIGLILDQMGWIWPEWRILADGDALDDFSADGSQNAFDLIESLLETELGTVYVRGDGVFVYESRGMAEARPASLTLSTAATLGELVSGVDADSILTRATVTKTDPTGMTDGTTWNSVDSLAEMRLGRADVPAISSPYVPGAWGQVLTDELVFRGVNGKPPATATATSVDDEDADLANILSTPLQSVIEIDDSLGGTEGEYILLGFTHTIDSNTYESQLTLAKRVLKAFTLASAIDGPDVIRY